MINKLRDEEKGITLVTLAITVILLVIITMALAKNSYSNLQLTSLTKLQNDIEILNNRVAAYYVKNGKLPIRKITVVDSSTGVNSTKDDTMTKSEVMALVGDVYSYDNDNYFVLDISELDNVTLNYGNAYNSSKTATDKYVINEETHRIYYLKGINYDGEEYHTIGLNS